MNRAATYLSSLARAVAAVPPDALAAVERALWATYERDGTIIACGNGGSAATASHVVCDLAKWTVSPGKRRLRALALTDNMPVFSAWANDTAYERAFVEQLMALYRPGDTILAISGSGNSPNVLRAVEWANEQGAVTVGLSGFSGGALAGLARVSLVAPSQFMPEVEDVHSAICHALAVSLGERLKAA